MEAITRGFISQVGARRLNVLAEYLKSVPKEKFNLSSWARGYPEDLLDTDKVKKLSGYQKFLNMCGTTGCAFGWATAIPEFRKAGLKLYSDYSRVPIDVALNEQIKSIKSDDFFGVSASDKRREYEYYYVEYKDYEDFDAAEKFFHISLFMAYILFHPSNYTTKQLNDPNSVSYRISTFLMSPDSLASTLSRKSYTADGVFTDDLFIHDEPYLSSSIMYRASKKSILEKMVNS